MPRPLNTPRREPGDTPGAIRGLDGMLRSPEEELKLWDAIVKTFGSAMGSQVLIWMRSISVETVCQPDVSDGFLRQVEGMRHMVKLIEKYLTHQMRR